MTTTTEKYITTGPAGAPSGIPGLELLDKELQDVSKIFIFNFSNFDLIPKILEKQFKNIFSIFYYKYRKQKKNFIPCEKRI